jgi:adenylate kinase
MFEWKSIRFALIRHLYWRIRKPRIYVLLGAPGSGKGKVAKPLARKLKAAPLSTGDIFRRERANQTPLGQRLASYMDNGRLVPDALVLAVIREELKRTKYRNGVVFDGFPRTVLQARGLDMILDSLGLAVEGALLLDPDEQVLIERLSNRLTCSNTQCG